MNLDQYKQQIPDQYYNDDEQEVYVKCDICLDAYPIDSLITTTQGNSILHRCDYCEKELNIINQQNKITSHE